MTIHRSQAASTPATLPIGRSRRVRSRVGRSLVFLSLGTAVLCTIVVWHRDATFVIKSRDRITPAIAPINVYLSEHGVLPLVYPVAAALDHPPADHGFTYVEEPVVRWARTAGRPVVVGWGKSAGLIVKPNGRAVAVLENGVVRVDWMAGRDLGRVLDQQREAAGFPAANHP